MNVNLDSICNTSMEENLGVNILAAIKKPEVKITQMIFYYLRYGEINK